MGGVSVQPIFNVIVGVGLILMCSSGVFTIQPIDNKLEEFQKLTHTIRKRTVEEGTLGYVSTCRPTSTDEISIPILVSCDALKINGFRFNGVYLIDPDGADIGLDPFSVVCDMTSDLVMGYTTIHHDKEEDGNVNNHEDTGSFQVDITYDLDPEQIEAIKYISSTCRQFIKYACVGSLFTGGYHYWVSVNGEQMFNWGGVPTGTVGCACGMTNTCDDTSKHCNCDVNDLGGLLRYDQGYLTDIATLPVSQLRFGDTGQPQEKGVYTLGPLQCA